MTLPVPVAVLGSCVTRDVFNSRFNPHYRELFECVVTGNQMSLVSLVEPPLDVEPDVLGELDAVALRDALGDLNRTFWQDLAATQPEYLLLDFFADVHFGCAELQGGRIVTRNRWTVLRTEFYRSAWVRDIPPDSDDYFDHWTTALAATLERVARLSPGTSVILHDTRNVMSYRRADGLAVEFGNADELERMNLRWKRMNAHAKKVHGLPSLKAMRKTTISAEDHPWGPFPVHFELAYHAAFLTQLTAKVLGDARSPAPPERRRWFSRGHAESR